ncbi:MAG: T9SS type A sorting domain-containing protein [Prolixibacteraceae bacterium]|nr:T9SS type A sorting domain-containing protein [Prolixibacteraceae bacterium]
MIKTLTILIICLFSIITICQGKKWNVGATQTYKLPSQISNLVGNGDTIYIDGGVYSNDATKWSRKNLKFIGRGTGSNRTRLKYTGDIPNGKGIFVFETPGTSDNAYIENIVFDGAQVSNGNGGNGAGIRFQAVNLTIQNCLFVNCQNGILEGNGSVTSSNVIIKDSEFQNNGYQLQNDPTYSGYEHNIYIGASTDTLVVQNCYFHNPRGQANSLKTRAQRSFILYNLIDESTGYGSWELNIAQGGLNVILGNIIIQGPSGANHGIIGYDAVANPLEDFYFINNTVINKFQGKVNFINIAPASGIKTFKIYNNIFASVSGATNTICSGNVPVVLDSLKNIITPNYSTVGFTNPSVNDYSLKASATLAINKGTNAGMTNTSYSLTPVHMYRAFSILLLPRTVLGGTIDIGSYEYGGVTNLFIQRTDDMNWALYPNPSSGKFTLECFDSANSKIKLEFYNLIGELLFKDELIPDNSKVVVNTPNLPDGIYLLKAQSENESLETKVIIVN